MKLKKYILRRLLFLVPVFLGSTMIIFFMMNLAGNPVYMKLGRSPGITAETIKNLERYYNLDKPIWQRYWFWLLRLFQGDLGESFVNGRPVLSLITSWGYESIKIISVSVVLSLLLAIPIAVEIAARQYSKTDFVVTSLSLFGYSMPIFWLGIMLLYFFAYRIPIFPGMGAHSVDPSSYPFGSYFLDELWHMILPVIVLSVQFFAQYVRLIRSNVIEELRKDYVLLAKASGLDRRTILYQYALRNALIPVVTLAALNIVVSIVGAPITESVFSWPGLGFFFVRSVIGLDYPVIIGASAFLIIALNVGNLLTDIVYAVIDPTIRLD